MWRVGALGGAACGPPLDGTWPDDSESPRVQSVGASHHITTSATLQCLLDEQPPGKKERTLNLLAQKSRLI